MSCVKLLVTLCVIIGTALCAPATPDTVLALDFSNNIAGYNGYATIVEFMQAFFDGTSTADIFSRLKPHVRIVPFENGILPITAWTLNYTDYQNAQALQQADRGGSAKFVETISAKVPGASANVGATLQGILDTYNPQSGWEVIIASDFAGSGDLSTVLAEYSSRNVDVHPVLLGTPNADQSAYNSILAAGSSGYGLVASAAGYTPADVQGFFSFPASRK